MNSKEQKKLLAKNIENLTKAQLEYLAQGFLHSVTTLQYEDSYKLYGKEVIDKLNTNINKTLNDLIKAKK